MAEEEVTGTQKAAILMALLGEDAAGNVLKHLEQTEIRQITMELAKIRMIDPTDHGAVIDEFFMMVSQARGLEMAGPHLARKLLSRAMPDEVDKLVKDPDKRKVRDEEDDGAEIALPELPESLVIAPARRLSLLLQEESPQTAALILAHLPPRKAARAMMLLTAEHRLEITRRMASIREVRPDVVARVSAVLEAKLAAINEEPLVPVNGVQTAADTLTKMGRAAGKEIVEAMADDYPELAKQLREMLFTFDMLRGLGDRDAQELLRQVDRSTLGMALKGADPELGQIFLNNMSERAAQMLQEEMDLLGAPRVTDIDKAQRMIIELALKLENEGTITLAETPNAA